MELSTAEEKYLKSILILSASPDRTVSTNAIAANLKTSAASVTDMLKRLSDKGLIAYERYKGASLLSEGQRIATTQIRKNRLWEFFLVNTLGMSWDEIHEIAEHLEHIPSDRLVDLLDNFLGSPKFDPHGDPIPNARGNYTMRAQTPLSDLQEGQQAVIIGVRNDDPAFLKNLTEKGLTPGTSLHIISKDSYDSTMRLAVENKELNISGLIANTLLIKPI